MAELKTKPTGASVSDFLAAIPDERRRADSEVIVALMQEVTGEPPAMWGESMVGFGRIQYRYASGHTGEWALTGFAPRKDNLTLYLNCEVESGQFEDLMPRLGKHKMGKACLYIKRLSDVDMGVLRALVERSVRSVRETTTPANSDT